MAARSVNRRDLLTLALAGAGVVWFVATNKKLSVHYTVPEVDLASPKALIDADAKVHRRSYREAVQGAASPERSADFT